MIYKKWYLAVMLAIAVASMPACKGQQGGGTGGGIPGTGQEQQQPGGGTSTFCPPSDQQQQRGETGTGGKEYPRQKDKGAAGGGTGGAGTEEQQSKKQGGAVAPQPPDEGVGRDTGIPGQSPEQQQREAEAGAGYPQPMDQGAAGGGTGGAGTEEQQSKPQEGTIAPPPPPDESVGRDTGIPCPSPEQQQREAEAGAGYPQPMDQGIAGGGTGGAAGAEAAGMKLPTVRLGAGYGRLFSPGLDDINDLPGSSINRGGFSFGVQALFGRMPLLPGVYWGLEADYMRLFHYELSDFFDTEADLASIPVLVLWEYPFKTSGSFKPLLQWGAGAEFSSQDTRVLDVSEKDNRTDFALAVGPGFSVDLSRKFSLITLLKYYHFFTRNDDTTLLNLSLNIGFDL